MSLYQTTSRDALIVVDMQNDFCPGGALPVPGGHDIVPLINRIAAQFENVVLTQDWHPAGHISFASTHGNPDTPVIEVTYGEQRLWPDHCVQGSVGADFHPDLAIPHAQVIVRKGFRQNVDSYSAFLEGDKAHTTGLLGYLVERGIKRIFVVGLALDFCVFWTAKNARSFGLDLGLGLGLEVAVIEDATRGIDVDGSVDKAWAAMDEVGVAKIQSSDLAI